MFITGSLKFFIMVGLISRLFFLQVKENKKYLTLSDKNRIREWKLAPVRGEITDYFGNVIAGNFEAYQLHIIPEQVEDFRYVIYRVKDLLEMTDKEFDKVLKKKNEIKPWETTEYAAEKIYDGLINKKVFEIHFPKTLTLILKIFSFLPSTIYFGLISKMTKYQKKN